MYIAQCHTVFFTRPQQSSIHSEHIIIIYKNFYCAEISWNPSSGAHQNKRARQSSNSYTMLKWATYGWIYARSKGAKHVWKDKSWDVSYWPNTNTVNSKELVQQPRNPWLQSLFKLWEQKVVQNLMIEAVWAFLQQWAINMDCDLFRSTGNWLLNIHEMHPCTLWWPKHKIINWHRNLNLYLTPLESLSSIVHLLRVTNIHCISRIFINELLVTVNQPPPNSWSGWFPLILIRSSHGLVRN